MPGATACRRFHALGCEPFWNLLEGAKTAAREDRRNAAHTAGSPFCFHVSAPSRVRFEMKGLPFAFGSFYFNDYTRNKRQA